MQQLNRAEPNLPAHAYNTFAIKAPISTHFRRASCEEVACPNWLNGWRVRVESLTPEMLHAAKTSGRKWVEQQIAPDETWLVYEAGQSCFRATQHKTRLDRPELYLVRGGDWRHATTPPRTHSRPEHWVEEFAQNQDRLNQHKQRG